MFRLSPLESTFGASLRFFCLFLPIFAHLFYFTFFVLIREKNRLCIREDLKHWAMAIRPMLVGVLVFLT